MEIREKKFLKSQRHMCDWAKFIKFSTAELACLWQPQTVLARKFYKFRPINK
jgi:hypothetical protein